jgi:enoyl-CoA hydratase/carnithine racemase
MITAAENLSAIDRSAYGPFVVPYLAVDLSRAASADTAWLSELPCPILGVGETSHPIARSCDVVVPVAQELAAIIANIQAAPIAAMTLVQTLRATEHLPIQAALTVESLAYATLQGGCENRAWLAARPPPPAPPQDTTVPLLLHRADTSLSLTLNRPEARNGINIALRDALCEGLALAALDPAITAIHLQGAGKCFSIGGALEEFGSAPDQATAHAIRLATGPAFHLAAVAGRTTAHIHGACIGAGAELASLCAHVIARENTFFQLPEIRFGLIPGSGGTVGIARRIGRQRAGYMMLSARRIGFNTALNWGLIDRVESASF